MADNDDPIAELVEPQPTPPSDPSPEPVMAEPMNPEPVIAAPAKTRRPSLIGPVIGGVVAAAIGFGLAQVVPKGWPIMDTTALEAKVAAQADETKALQAKITALAETPAAAPDQALTDRVAKLETAITAAPAPDAILDQRVTAVEQRLTTIETLPADGSPAATAALAQLQADVTALKSGGTSPDALQQVTAAIDAKLAEAETKISAIKTEAEATAKSATSHAAVRQIAAALDSGAPYSAALTDLADARLPPILTDSAETGLPTLQSLRASFPDAARAALEASQSANMGESWTTRASVFLRNQTGARSLTPRDGTDADAVLSRAEAALTTGDLATVLTELAALPPEGQAAMADWQAQATKRQAALVAVQSLAAATGG